MTPADKARRIALVTAAVGVMPVAAVVTNTVHGIVAQRDAAQARVGALEQRLRHTPAPSTVTPSPGSIPQPAPSASGSVTVVAAGPAQTGSSGVSAGGGGVAAFRPGPTPPSETSPSQRSSPSSPPASQPPAQQAACSTVRVRVETPPLGVLACGAVHTTARIGRPVP